jgi:hypothetical protein
MRFGVLGVECDARPALDVVVVLCAGINNLQVLNKLVVVRADLFGEAFVDQVVKVKDKLAQSWPRLEKPRAAQSPRCVRSGEREALQVFSGVGRAQRARQSLHDVEKRSSKRKLVGFAWF